MRDNKLTFAAAIVLMLTMATTALVAGTYAKYITTTSATGTVTVAQWKPLFMGEDEVKEEITFNFFEEGWADAGVAGQLLAPGTSGSFELQYDLTNIDTAVELIVTLDASELLDQIPYFRFYLGDNNDITDNAPGNLFYERFAADEGDREGVIKVHWEWPFELQGGTEEDKAARDEADTEVGLNPAAAAIIITFTATQLDH